MPDREKVISELDKIADEANPWKESPPLRCDLPYPLLLDALALLNEQEGTINELQNAYGYLQKQFFEVQDKLLKEQEAVEPIPPTDESDLWRCGNCNHQLFRCTHQRYCGYCGQEVKWE